MLDSDGRGTVLDEMLKLGFAELEFLLGGQPGWARMRENLGGDVPDSPQVPAAGAASLLARDLAVIGPDERATPEAWVRALALVLVDCPCPVGVSLVLDGRVAPAVYCPTADGRRVLVSIEDPGVAGFQSLPVDELVLDQALGLVERALVVPGGLVIVKLADDAGLMARHVEEGWLLGAGEGTAGAGSGWWQCSEQDVVSAVRLYLSQGLPPELLGVAS